MAKEAKARIKINKLLEFAGWRFFDNAKGKANILLKSNTTIHQYQLDAFGDNLQNSKKGYIEIYSISCAKRQIIIFKQKIKDRIALVWGE